MEVHLDTLEYPKIVRLLSGLSFSAPGQERCEAIAPTSDLETARFRLKETSDAVSILLAKGTPALHGISDIRATVVRAMRGSDLNMGELLKIAAVLRTAGRMKALVPEGGPADNLVYELMDRLSLFRRLEQDLSKAIISEEEMADSASVNLASIRKRIKSQQASIRETLDRIIRGQGKYLQEALITQRNGRYVVPVKAEHKGQVAGIVHDASGSGQTLFVEPMGVVSANNKIRELMSEEADEIEAILHDFSLQISEEGDSILANSEALAQIDFAIAKGRLALQMKAMPPNLNKDGKINLRQARHPLISAKDVVPIDLHLGDAFQTLLVTGPNTGGKTVALKTCGLLTLMAMSGLEIPAKENSDVSVFENVLADIGDEQSIEQSLSTFSGHMKNLVHITNIVTTGSLVLTDELGSGTDPSEGAALAMSILEHLRHSGAVTMATTHYKELKAYALETSGVENASVEFDTETLRPTYRLMIGVPGVSNAFIISEKLGLAASIIERAGQLLTDEGRHFEDLLRDLDKRGRDAERLREEAVSERNLVRRERQRFEREQEAFEGRKSDILARTREEGREQLREQLQIIEQLIADINEAYQSGDFSDALSQSNRLRSELRGRLNEIEGEIGRETLKQVRSKAGDRPGQIDVGQSYFSTQLNMTGKAITEPDNKGMILLQTGSMQIKVSKDSLLIPDETKQEDTSARDKAVNRLRGDKAQGFVSKAAHFRPEIKLLGQTSDEALTNLDHFLDDAVLASVQSVRIVHGKGSGVLRDAVRKSLKQDRRVRQYRQAEYGEGDSGVTIAELK